MSCKLILPSCFISSYLKITLIYYGENYESNLWKYFLNWWIDIREWIGCWFIVIIKLLKGVFLAFSSSFSYEDWWWLLGMFIKPEDIDWPFGLFIDIVEILLAFCCSFIIERLFLKLWFVWCTWLCYLERYSDNNLLVKELIPYKKFFF